MIEFKGEISVQSKNVLFKYQIKGAIIWAVAIFIVFIPSLIYFTIYIHNAFIYGLIIPTIFIIIFLIKPLIKLDKPKHIIIENESMNIMCEKSANVRRIDSIKKIIDYGNCYFVIFRFPHNYFSCLCQKDLLSNGTLEKFEELFQNYIIKKDFK